MGKKKKPSVVRLVLAYINPVKYPFYIIIVLGIITLIDISSNIKLQERWYYIVIPIYISMLLSLYLAFIDKQSLDDRQAYEFQMKLARTIGIIVPFACLIAAGEDVLDDNKYLILYLPCLFQIFIFMIYAYFAIRHEKEYFSKFNFIQLLMITTSLVVGLTYSSISYIDAFDKHKKSSASLTLRTNLPADQSLENLYNNGTITYEQREKFSRLSFNDQREAVKKEKHVYFRYELLLIGFLFLWSICQTKWIHQLIRSINIIIVEVDEHDDIFKAPSL